MSDIQAVDIPSVENLCYPIAYLDYLSKLGYIENEARSNGEGLVFEHETDGSSMKLTMINKTRYLISKNGEELGTWQQFQRLMERR